MLPILHLNGYKIANPTILGRMPDDEVIGLFRGYGYEPITVAGSDPSPMHQRMAAVLDKAIGDIHSIQELARKSGGKGDKVQPPRWPLIILRSPKGWTGPKEVDGKKVEGFWRAHQVPIDKVRDNSEHLRLLEEWMRSYRPQELFGEAGRLAPEIVAMAPAGRRRMGANPHANGGLLKLELRLPDFRAYAVHVENPGGSQAEATRVMGSATSCG